MPRSARAPFVLLLASLSLVACGSNDGGRGDETTGVPIPGTSSSASSSSSTTVTTAPDDASATLPDPTTGDPATSTAPAGTTTTGPVDPTTGDATSTSTSTATTDATTTAADTTDTGGLPPGSEFRVLQLNLCHSGVAGCFTGDDVMIKAAAVIGGTDPHLVTLNEVCRQDVPTLAMQTGAVDHRFTPALKADDTPVKCKNGDDYGNGLLSWIPAAWDAPVHGVYAAQSSMTERRVWICMGYQGFTGCTTHLSTAGATALAQCKEVVGGPLATAAAMGPAVLAGDWNLKYDGSPDAQDCVPPGFFRKGDGSVQHVIASDDLGFLETIKIDMDGTTDHPGLEVRLVLP